MQLNDPKKQELKEWLQHRVSTARELLKRGTITEAEFIRVSDDAMNVEFTGPLTLKGGTVLPDEHALLKKGLLF